MAEKKAGKKRVSRASANRKQKKGDTEVREDPLEVEEGVYEDEQPPKNLKLPKSCHHTFQSFLDRNQLTQENATVYIYKFTGDSSQSARELCTQVSGTMPTEHDIGVQFGGGKYHVIIQAVNGDGVVSSTSKTFHLHRRYDTLSEMAGSNPMMFQQQFLTPSAPGTNGGGGSSLNEMLGLMQAFMGILNPLIQGNNKQQSQPEYMGQMFAENFKMMNQAMKDVYADTSQFLNDKMRDSAGAGETVESESEVTGVMGLMSTIIPLLDKFLPVILSKDKVGSNLTIETIKAMPEFRKFTKDRKMVKQLISHIYVTHGEDAAKKACKRFKIKYVSPKLKQQKQQKPIPEEVVK